MSEEQISQKNVDRMSTGCSMNFGASRWTKETRWIIIFNENPYAHVKNVNLCIQCRIHIEYLLTINAYCASHNNSHFFCHDFSINYYAMNTLVDHNKRYEYKRWHWLPTERSHRGGRQKGFKAWKISKHSRNLFNTLNFLPLHPTPTSWCLSSFKIDVKL